MEQEIETEWVVLKTESTVPNNPRSNKVLRVELMELLRFQRFNPLSSFN